jgi:hypothetical protein
MRIELHVILWVIAVLGGVASVLSGSLPRDYLPFSKVLGPRGYFPFAAEHVERKTSGPEQTLDLTSTSIFPKATGAVVPEFSAPPPPPPTIVLKGIVDSEGVLKAVLASETGNYATVGIGEQFFGATVASVSSDGATLLRDDGPEVKLILRGAGEQPH